MWFPYLIPDDHIVRSMERTGLPPWMRWSDDDNEEDDEDDVYYGNSSEDF